MSKQRKFSKRKQEQFLELLSEGCRRGSAAKTCGVHRNTPSRLMRDDEGFAEAVELAELNACENVEDALYKQAIGGHVVACLAWLHARDPVRWPRPNRPTVIEPGDDNDDPPLYCSDCRRRFAGKHPGAAP